MFSDDETEVLVMMRQNRSVYDDETEDRSVSDDETEVFSI